jgi:hypothetical protein
MAFQPVRGISADHVTNIPKEWSKEWFRGFIRNHMEQMDVRNAVAGPGIAINTAAAKPSHTLLARAIISTGATGPAFPNQSPNTILAGPPSGGSNAPTFRAIVPADLPGTFSGFANPSALVGLNPVNGAATTAMRSDAAPALDQGIVPTWTGAHVFNLATKFVLAIGVNNNTPPAQVTGFGTPTGTGVIANFPGATATLAQATQAIAQLITDLKAIGFYAA